MLRFPGSTMPVYGRGSTKVSMKFYIGGKFIHTPEAMYQGGRVIIFDNVEIEDLSLFYLDRLCESCGLVGFMRYYVKQTDGFYLLQSDVTLHELCMGNDKTTEVELYIDQDLSRINESQVGSSNMVHRVDENDNDSSDFDNDDEIVDGSGSDDSDYSFADADYDMNEDDELFQNNVDPPEEWDGLDEPISQNVKEKGVADDDSCSGSKDLVDSDGDIDSCIGSDDEKVMNQPHMFNAKRDMYDPDLYCNLSFADFGEFKEAVRNYSIKRGRAVKFYKNDKLRCRAKCRSDGCKWDIYARMMKDRVRPVIRSFYSSHNCSFNPRNPSVTSKWIGKEYLNDFKFDPKLHIQNFRKKVMNEVKCQITKWQAYRAREAAFRTIRGVVECQYAIIWNYIGELKRVDPDATIILKLCDTENVDVLFDSERHETVVRPTGKPRFHRMYCSMSAMKNGFLAGCRPIFGIDGCHMKGQHQGVLLAAVGLDPNNNLFPIAYALVEVESKDSWSWFLRLLKEDLKIAKENENEWTIVSDKQKGLIGACDEVVPGADHRFCVRHLYTNWVSAGFTGKNLKNALYEAATATTVPAFKQALRKISSIDSEAAKWLNDKDVKCWSRSGFSTIPKCDMIVNNVCESFNSSILDARDLPIIHMFEWLRHYMMVRFQEKRDMAREKWVGMRICPKILRKLQDNIERAANCIAFKSNDDSFECQESDGRICIVNLRLWSCSCRKWELNGIPCSHACAAYSLIKKDPVDFVDGCYGVETFSRVYQFAIPPMTSSDNWIETDRVGPLPPLERVQAGRPKHKRRKSQGEVESSRYGGSKKQSSIKKLSRKGIVGACSFCKQNGHNIRSCQKKKQEVSGVDLQSTSLQSGKRKSPTGSTPAAPSRKIPRDMEKASNTLLVEQNASPTATLRRSPRKVLSIQQGGQNSSPTATLRRSPRKTSSFPQVTRGTSSCVANEANSASNGVPRMGSTKSSSSKVSSRGITKSQLLQKKASMIQAYRAKGNLKCNDGVVDFTWNVDALPPPSS